MKIGNIYIGTSGWHYKHWTGTFYPAGTKANEQFAYYAGCFSTVEINNSFYRMPSVKTFREWQKAAPADFVYAVKASRYITHLKKLKTEAGSLDMLFGHAGTLADKLGPFLFQLPPGWKINTERLKEFLHSLPRDHRYTFEFRNHSWYTDEVYNLLKEHNCAFCIYELAGHISPFIVTADFVYIRLHGPGNKYQGSYSAAALKRWAGQCLQWQKKKKDVYLYFDNDEKGYAALNALSLKKLVEKNAGK